MRIGLTFSLVSLEVVLSFFPLLYECTKMDGYKFPVYSTEVCPQNETSWIERSSALHCNESKGYTCLPNQDFTHLLEFCYTDRLILIEEGVCLYLVRNISLVNARSCRNFRYGCPTASYLSNRIFEHPSCVSIGDGCFLAEPFCERSAKTTTAAAAAAVTTTTTTTYDRKRESEKIRENKWIGITTFFIYFLIFAAFCIQLIYHRKGRLQRCKPRGDEENLLKDECTPGTKFSNEKLTEKGSDDEDYLILSVVNELKTAALSIWEAVRKLSQYKMAKEHEKATVKDRLQNIEYQDKMVHLCEEIIMTTQKMVGKSFDEPAFIRQLADQLKRDFEGLTKYSEYVVTTSNCQETANNIIRIVQDLGNCCAELVQGALKVRNSKTDDSSDSAFPENAKNVEEKVSSLIQALPSDYQGILACVSAARTVRGIVAELETTIIFTTAGALCKQEDECFASYKDDMVKTANALVDDTKRLVKGTASDQETLAGAAQQAVKTITKLADVVKLGAASLGSDQQEAQLMIISAAKDVASAFSDVTLKSKNASGKNMSDLEMLDLEKSTEVMEKTVLTLLKKAETVEDKVALGIRALESTIEAIEQEIKVNNADAFPEKKANDLIQLTKLITTATTKAVAAGNSGRYEDVILCAKMGREAIFGLLASCRGTASTATIRQNTLAAGKKCASVYNDLLKQLSKVVQMPSQKAKEMLAVNAHQVAISVNEIVNCSKLIEGKTSTVMDESMMLQAVKSIEAALKKLSQPENQLKAVYLMHNDDGASEIELVDKSQFMKAGQAIEMACQNLVNPDSSQQQVLFVATVVAKHTSVLCNTCHLASSKTSNPVAKRHLVRSAKKIANSTDNLVKAIMVLNQDFTEENHSLCAKAATPLRDAVDELTKFASSQEFASIPAKISPEIDKEMGIGEEKSFEEYRIYMVSQAKKIDSIPQEMVSNIADFMQLVSQLTREYEELASNSANAAATSYNPDITNRICIEVRDLGKSCIDFVKNAWRVQCEINDPSTSCLLHKNIRSVKEKVSFVLKALQSGSGDIQTCIKAKISVSGIIADLDTTLMFANIGSLCKKDDESFPDPREIILKIANTVVKDTKMLVQDTLVNQKPMAGDVEQAVKTITKLSDAVKLVAASLGSDQQEDLVMIINAVKDVASTLSDLMSAIMNASGKNVYDPAMMTLKESAKMMVTTVTAFQRTMTDEIAWKSWALESNIEATGQKIKMMKSLLENANKPVTNLSYFECLDFVVETFKLLVDSMTGITNSVTKGDLDIFCDTLGNFSTSVCGLAETASHAAYLVGIADGTSEPGRPGLVDQCKFARADQAIQMACQNLVNPSSSQQQVLSAATVVAKHTSALCNACRLASSKTSNPVAKRHFVQSAKDVANSTANLVKAIKALDQDFTEENRQRCAEAAKPLTDAVDELTTFASSPEFASMPAKISPEARKAQEPIVSAGKAMIDGACNMVTATKQLAVNPKDPPTYQLYSNHSKSVSEAIKRLVSSIKDCAPGQRECDESIDKLNRSIRDLDQALLAAISQSLQQRTEKSLRGFQEQMIGSAREIHDLCSKVEYSAKAEPENLGHMVTMMASYFGPLSDGAVGAASLIHNSKQQTHILDLTKTVAESALQFMYSCKEGGGNPKAPKHTHDNIDTAADNTMDVVQDLLQSLEEAASQAGVVNSMIEKLTKSITKTDEQVMVREGMSFVEYQSNMVSLAKKIAMTTQEMVGKAGVKPSDLWRLANQLTQDYDVLASNSANAAATSSSQDIANRIRTTVQDLGKSCVELVQDAGKVQGDPHDTCARRDLQEHARSVSEKVAFLLAALQSRSCGTQACINAASAVSGIIADLDTTIMFATAGTLCTEGDDSFASHREDILKTAKALVEETKKLVQGAASDQETLAGAAQQAVKTITKLADVVKLSAASLGSNQPEAQVMIINAVKNVASALSDLISATKNASGKNVSDPAMMTLKESAKVMVTNVTSLLKTVKTVEDEAARGTRALESTTEAIGQEIKSYEAGTLPERKATAEDLIRLTKPITTATAKAVAAGNSGRQEDVIICANMGRKAIVDLLATCRGTASTAETTEVRQKTIAAGKNCAVVYKDLLEQVSMVVQKPSQEAKQTLAARAHQVAVSVQEIVHCSKLIKDWVDPEDPTVIAESELLTAAKSIEAAAQKLSQLKPRKKAKEADMSLNFEEQILEAAKSIASATAALVKSASAAQKELVAQGKVRTRKEIGATYHKSQILDDDGQWSEGLISAAKMVAAATHSLCESANAMVQGHATEERLIASAKEVAGSTAHLLVACRVKADPHSVAMKRLQAAGNAVKRATEVLVKAAQQAKQRDEDEDIDVAVDSRKVGGIKQELQIQEEMLRKEREWIEAREKLAKFRKQRYKDTGHDSDSSSAF